MDFCFVLGVVNKVEMENVEIIAYDKKVMISLKKTDLFYLFFVKIIATKLLANKRDPISNLISKLSVLLNNSIKLYRSFS